MDDELMNDYLEKVRRNLKHLTEDEKTDIISEIKSHIKEKQANESHDMKAILDSLGDPILLGRAYGGKIVASTDKFNCRTFARTLAYYSANGFNGFVLSVLAGALYLSMFMVIIGGFIKTMGTIAGFDMKFVDFTIGNWQVPSILAFPISIPVALLIYYCSSKLWRLLKKYLSNSLYNF